MFHGSPPSTPRTLDVPPPLLASSHLITSPTTAQDAPIGYCHTTRTAIDCPSTTDDSTVSGPAPARAGRLLATGPIAGADPPARSWRRGDEARGPSSDARPVVHP